MNIETLQSEIVDAMDSMDAKSIDPLTFKKTGVAIVRGAIPQELLSVWTELWDEYRAKTLGASRTLENTNNPVEIKKLPSELLNISHSKHIVDLLKPVFGENIGVYQRRFVVKDTASKGAVILHQDSGYHVGTFEKASMFLALKPVTEKNGAMYLYPGTHNFGYLGDAGSINKDVLPQDWPVISPTLEAGDFMLMSSLTWHGSVPFVEGNERVMTDFIYQPAHDPSTVDTVCGDKGWHGSFLTESRNKIFLQCRSSKLREISGILNSTTS